MSPLEVLFRYLAESGPPEESHEFVNLMPSD